MATSNRGNIVNVDAAGALTGDGSSGNPLAVAVDGATIQIVGDQLAAVGGGTGDVVGPAGATDGNLVLFSGATGKAIQDAGGGLGAGVLTWLGTPTAANFGGATAIGADTQVIFNDGGTLSGQAGLTWDTTNVRLVLTSQLGVGAGTSWTDPVLSGSIQLCPSLSLSDVDVPANYAYGVTAETLYATSGDASNTSFYGVDTGVEFTANHATGSVIGLQPFVGLTFGADVTVEQVNGMDTAVSATGPGTISLLQVAPNYCSLDNVVVTQGSSYWAYAPVLANGATITAWQGYYADDLASAADQPYYLWFDSRGVFAVKEEFTQGVPRLYNPLFTKYTPGAADYERWITRYGITSTYGTSNVLYTGSEAGGTGTLRLLSLLGAGVQLESVPGTATFLQMAEMTAPSAPASNGVRIYAEDDGGGKTRLMAIFATGAAQQIAIQP